MKLDDAEGREDVLAAKASGGAKTHAYFFAASMRPDGWSRKLHFLDVKTRALEPGFQLLAGGGCQRGQVRKAQSLVVRVLSDSFIQLVRGALCFKSGSTGSVQHLSF